VVKLSAVNADVSLRRVLARLLFLSEHTAVFLLKCFLRARKFALESEAINFCKIEREINFCLFTNCHKIFFKYCENSTVTRLKHLELHWATISQVS